MSCGVTATQVVDRKSVKKIQSSMAERWTYTPPTRLAPAEAERQLRTLATAGAAAAATAAATAAAAAAAAMGGAGASGSGGGGGGAAAAGDASKWGDCSDAALLELIKVQWC